MPTPKTWIDLECYTCGKVSTLNSALACRIFGFIAMVYKLHSLPHEKSCDCLLTDAFRVNGIRHVEHTPD